MTMPKACAVPKCKTGRRTIKEKCSVFKMPSDNEQYKKWQAAIPGIVNLKQSQFVCEKHFENKYILRKRIHCNSNNEIIAEVSLFALLVFLWGYSSPIVERFSVK